MRVLITGAAGFIGSHAVAFFEQKGWTVKGIDVVAPRGPNRVDLADGAAFDRAARRFGPDAILHLGAFASVPGCEADPARCLRSNVLGTVHVARTSGQLGARLVFASTAAVYGDDTPVPTAVDAPTRPTNFYGISKLAGEHVCRDYAPDSAALRLFNVYGERCERTYVIPDVIRRLQKRPRLLPMEGTGQEARDFVYVEDVLRAMEIALSRRFRGAYNVGTGVRTSIRSLALTIAAQMGQPGIALRFAGPRAGDFRVSLANIRGKNRVPGWRPQCGLAEGLRRVIAAS